MLISGDGMKRVMISYSTQRSDVARRLHAALESAGVRPHLDQLDIAPGERWRESIAWWLASCHTAVVLLCPNALESPWVRYELSVLANRELAEGSVRLVLVYLGTDPGNVAASPELAPCRLSEIQHVHPFARADLTDEEIASLAKSVIGPAPDMPPLLSRRVGEAYERLKEFGAPALNDLRSRLQVADRNAGWEFDEEVPMRNDDERRLRVQAATELCLSPLGPPFASAMENAVMWHRPHADDVRGLVRLAERLAVDSRAARVVYEHRAGEPNCTVTIGGAQPATASATVDEMYDLFRPDLPYVHTHSRLMGDGPDEIAANVQLWLDFEIAQRYPGEYETARDYLDDMADLMNPVFVVLHQAAAITADVLDRIVKRLGPASVLVLADRDNPPRAIADRLGCEVAGIDLVGPEWDGYVDHEALRSKYAGIALRKIDNAAKRNP